MMEFPPFIANKLGMELEVTRGILTTVCVEATRAHPNECCGLLLGEGARIVRAQLCVNVHPRPDRAFEIDPAALIAAHRAARAGGWQVLGYFHSHPNGRIGPSAQDLALAARDGRIHAIVAGGEVTWWRDGDRGFEALFTRLAPG